MSNLRRRFAAFHTGRLAMRDAFIDLSTLARRAGVDEDAMTELHGRFFDGNVAVKREFAVLVLLTEVWRPRPDRSAD